jgi:hypothetical protein
MSRTLALALLFFLFSNPVWAQVSMAEFIRTAAEAPEVKALDGQVGYLDAKPYKLSPLQKMEFRTQNRELKSNQQEYALRFSPANPWEVRNNNRYFQNYQSALTLEKGLVLKDALLQRYMAIISFVYYADWKELAREQQALLDKQIEIAEKRTGSAQFDPDAYVRLKIAAIDRVVEAEEVEFDLLTQQSVIASLYAPAAQQEPGWRSSQLLSVDAIQEVVDSIQLATAVSARLAWQLERIALYQSEYKLEKANINMGFFQTEYDRRRVEQDRTPFNISLGITIPITNPNKGDMTKRKLDVIEAEQQLDGMKAEVTTEKEMKLLQVRNAMARYRALQKKVEELSTSPLPANLATIQYGDPLVTLQFSERVNRLRVLEAKVRRTLYSSYIDYLASTDHLQQTPIVDYLSAR